MIQLNFNEDAIDKSSALYALYTNLSRGMKRAAEAEAVDYSSAPPLLPNGEVDVDSISQQVKAYASISIKNSAYMFAESISQAFGLSNNGVVSGGGVFVSRAGDSMEGAFSALNGFWAGERGRKILAVSRLEAENLAEVFGRFSAHSIETNGTLKIGDVIINGVGGLAINSESTSFSGNIRVGNLTITTEGITIGDKEYYHKGNANLPTVDWESNNLVVHNNGNFLGNVTVGGMFQVQENGVTAVSFDNGLLHVFKPIFLKSDVAICSDAGEGLRFSGDAIAIGNDVSRVLLGDSDSNGFVILQSSLYAADGITKLVSSNGDGSFPNSFSAGTGKSFAPSVSTYLTSTSDKGVVFFDRVRFGATVGPYIDGSGSDLIINLPFSANEKITYNSVRWGAKPTDSYFVVSDKTQTIVIDTDANMFAFVKPIESSSFSIIGRNSRTQLANNMLLFNERAFIEGVGEGVMFYHGKSLFEDGLQSEEFSTGFSGKGWAIRSSTEVGGFEATFDSVIVRKKMRVYELEVQKISATNGALWVSDSCSGDLVEKV